MGVGEVLTLEWSPNSRHIAMLTRSRTASGSPEGAVCICPLRPSGSGAAEEGGDGEGEGGPGGLSPGALKLTVSGNLTMALAWSQDGGQLFVCGHDEKLVRTSGPFVDVVCGCCASRGVLLLVNARLLCQGSMTLSHVHQPQGHVILLGWHSNISHVWNMQTMVETGLGSQPGSSSIRGSWKPGKGYDVATSPDGRWLAVSYLDTVRLYSMEVIKAGKCSDTMREAEVRLSSALVG